MMIAIAEKPCQDPRKQANDRFLEMLPKICRRAQFAFRRMPSEQRAELVQETVANAYVAFVRLVDRGRADAAFATPLANYAIRRVLAVRLVGSGLSAGDVLSRGRVSVLRSSSSRWIRSTKRKTSGALHWRKIAEPGRRRLRLHGSTSQPGFVLCLERTA